MSQVSSHCYEFGHFCVDVMRRMLLRDGCAIPLSPKAFETLLALVQNRGRVLTKQELIERIWPDNFVEESNLAQHVFRLRKALGEEKTEHQYIVTIPGQGYQFVAEVRESSLARNGTSPRRFETSRPTVYTRTPTTLAVLPFRPLVAQGSDLFLGMGLADALITKLSNLKDLAVRPTSAVLKYNDSNQDPLAIGRELHVEAILDGIYQRDGEQFRVSIQLVSINDGITLWAARFDDKFTNLFDVQDSISEQVARVLALELSSEERRRLGKAYTENVDAFQLYIRGRYFWNKRSVEGLKKGITFAQQALARDPLYALAYVGMADSYNLLAGHGGFAPKETFPKAQAAALQALEIDDTLAEAYTSLGFVGYRFDWKWAEAEANFRRAIEIKPHYPTGHHWYGECLGALGRFEESIAELKQALELDPLSLPINADLAQSFYFSRRYDECTEQLRKTLEMEPNFVRALVLQGMVDEQKEEHRPQAIAHLRQAVELSGGNTMALAHLGYAYAINGMTDEAREVLNDLERLSTEGYVSAMNIALVYLGLKKHERVWQWLERAINNRDVWLVWLKVAPRWDALRSDSRFPELIRTIGLAP